MADSSTCVPRLISKEWPWTRCDILLHSVLTAFVCQPVAAFCVALPCSRRRPTRPKIRKRRYAADVAIREELAGVVGLHWNGMSSCTGCRAHQLIASRAAFSIVQYYNWYKLLQSPSSQTSTSRLSVSCHTSSPDGTDTPRDANIFEGQRNPYGQREVMKQLQLEQLNRSVHGYTSH